MTNEHDPTTEPQPEMKLHGVVGEYDNVDDLVEACEKVRDAGYTKWDAHTPFPVHGIDDAMGIKSTILPWIVLGGGLTGLGLATGMQWWMNAVDYPYIISGKPFWSLPASVPIMFELTVLLSALTAFIGLMVLNLLPEFYHPLFRSKRFARATDDRFFISIDAADPLFSADKTKALLSAAKSSVVEDVMTEANPAPFPRALIFGGIAAAALTFIPLAVVAKARFSKSNEPPLHVVWDMDWQLKKQEQDASVFFADGRASRPQVAGTVARGDYIPPEQMSFHTGVDLDGAEVTAFPIPVNAETMARGKERLEIYCAPCHGLDGQGDGMVALRAKTLQSDLTTPDSSGWVPPLSFVDPNGAIMTQTIGKIFQTITNGARTMPAYGSQIPPEDRWAIILYMRALQKAKNANYAELSPEDQAALRGR
ncbi:MAG: quinol:electron acceptor oxidoreductase subunit ActD [Planctomycetota bacterium JB042]